MSTETRNEAADVLRKTRPSGWAQDWWEDRIDEALAAERRAMVERIRAALDREMYHRPEVVAILDEEAAR